MTRRPARLTKRDVEVLLRDYDSDPVGALTVALRIVSRRPDAQWAELLDGCSLSDARRAALAVLEQDALDDLLTELNEERRLGA